MTLFLFATYSTSPLTGRMVTKLEFLDDARAKEFQDISRPICALNTRTNGWLMRVRDSARLDDDIVSHQIKGTWATPSVCATRGL